MPAYGRVTRDETEPLNLTEAQQLKAIHFVQAIAACRKFEGDTIHFLNSSVDTEKELASKYVADALALLHEIGWF